MSDGPRRVEDHREPIRQRLRDAPGVLLCLDFDGTLSPIVDDPDEATLAPECGDRLRRLVERPSVEVAIVSGRALRDLERRVGIDGITYAGNHGLELRRDGERKVHPDASDYRPELRRICERIEEHTASIPGVRVENKGVTATVHYRQVPNGLVSDVVETVSAAVDAADADLSVVPGKAIRELRPAVDWDKGDVVRQLASEVSDEWITVYVGDDTTDEDAFAVVEPEGIAVHVGTDRTTDASYRVDDQPSVASFLDLVVDATG